MNFPAPELVSRISLALTPRLPSYRVAPLEPADHWRLANQQAKAALAGALSAFCNLPWLENAPIGVLGAGFLFCIAAFAGVVPGIT